MRVTIKARKVMFIVNRDRDLSQKREVEQAMRETVAEVMGKGTQVMYHDHMNIQTDL